MAVKCGVVYAFFFILRQLFYRYNLQGQRVSQPVKGVYVKDGKKVLK